MPTRPLFERVINRKPLDTVSRSTFIGDESIEIYKNNFGIKKNDVASNLARHHLFSPNQSLWSMLSVYKIALNYKTYTQLFVRNLPDTNNVNKKLIEDLQSKLNKANENLKFFNDTILQGTPYEIHMTNEKATTDDSPEFGIKFGSIQLDNYKETVSFLMKGSNSVDDKNSSAYYILLPMCPIIPLDDATASRYDAWNSNPLNTKPIGISASLSAKDSNMYIPLKLKK